MGPAKGCRCWPERTSTNVRLVASGGLRQAAPATKGVTSMDDVLAHELATLRAEVARLRARVEPAEEGLSRRRLLRAAPAVALGGALAAIAGATPASAAVGDAVRQGEDNHYGTGTTALFGGDPSNNLAALDVTGGLRADIAAIGAAAFPNGDAVLAVTAQPMSSSDPGPGHPAVTIFGGEVVGPYHNT